MAAPTRARGDLEGAPGCARNAGCAVGRLRTRVLLTLAAEHFDVFVTVDRNLAFQQNVAAFSIAVFVLRARTNRLADLKSLVPNLLGAIDSALSLIHI